MFLMVDGIDGCGKGTIITLLKEVLVEQGKSIADLRDFSKTEHRYARAEDIGATEIVMSAEPSYTHIGAGIREYLLKDAAYNPLLLAHAFSIDRAIHYHELILPALAQQKHVVMDRGVSSSLVYQSSPERTLATIAALPGNVLALAHPPTHLLLLDCSVDTALARLAARAKQDETFLEKKDFLTRCATVYQQKDFRDIFHGCGTTILTLSTEGGIEDVRKRLEENIVPFFLSE